jgi:hypothetical protein
MDDFLDDFGNDYDGGGDDDANDGSCDDDFSDIETDGEDDTTFETDDGFWDFPTASDWGIIGPMSEEIAEERREQEQLRRKR